MRCDIHPDQNAVGTCVYCGRGVCDQCKVRLYDKIHCKECVEAGRIRGAPEPQAAPPQGPPGAPPGMGYPQYPGYTGYPGVYMAPVIFKPPNPKGIPRKGYFQFGMFACFATMVMSFIVFILMCNSLFNTYGEARTTDFFIVAILVLTFFLYPMFISFFGFYKNYGSSAALMTVIGGVTLVAFYQFLWGYYTFMYVFNRSEYYYNTEFLVFFTQLLLGGALLLATFTIRAVSFYMVPMSPGRRATTGAIALTAAAAIAFLCMLGVYLFGWILLALAMGFLGNMFMNAPMPEPPGARMMLQPPMMAPPPPRQG